MSEIEKCPCGRPLHYSDPKIQEQVEDLIQRLGPNVRVTTRFGNWMVPRHYIALHGFKAHDLPVLALRYGWEQT